MFEKLKQLIQESIIYGLNGVLGKFIGLFLVPIYTRIFEPADYGVLDLIGVCSFILSLITVLGLDTAQSLYFYSTDDLLDRKRTLTTSVTFQFGLSLTIALALYIFSVDVSVLIFKAPAYAIYFKLVALDLPFLAIWGFTHNVLRLMRSPWKYSFFAIGTLIFNTTLTIIMVVVLKKGIYGIYLSKLLVDILFAGVAIYLIYPNLGRAFSWGRLKQLLVYGIPLVPASLAFWLLTSSNRYFLQSYLSLNEVGLYAVGNKIAGFAALFMGAFQLAWNPFAMSIHREKDAKYVYANVLTYYFVFMSGIVLTLSLFATEILVIFTTKAYYQSSIVVPYLAFSIVAYGAYYIAMTGVSITKQTSHIGWTSMVAATINVGLNFLLIPRIGMAGAAIAVLIGQWISAGLLFLVAQHYYPIPYRFRQAAIILVSSASLIILGNHIQIDSPWLSILFKASLVFFYLAILLSSRILDVTRIFAHLPRSISLKFTGKF